ncbi:MAG TPA: hypothetical protein VNI54_13330 [Thermoanaerobaculia bacterium]|nr:hypothetical protein [Thermoanaerobaculia bacterium]
MQVISIAGALMVLSAYTAHQLRRLRFRTYTYQLLNLCGGAMLCWAAVSTRQAGLILMEGAWTVVSAYGVWTVWRRG